LIKLEERKDGIKGRKRGKEREEGKFFLHASIQLLLVFYE
jgi:hypothetical protein